MILLKGFAFGFVLAASVGPMWVLCLQRTLAHGTAAGLASGMGIAAADGFYGAVAAFGLTAISGFLLEHQYWFGLFGAAFLLWLGFRTLLSEPPEVKQATGEGPGSHLAAFFSTLGLTLANPPTILAFAAIFAGLGLTSDADYATASLVVLAVFLGSASWWIILAAGADWLRQRLNRRFLRGINVASGVFILSIAAWQAGQLI